MRKFSYILLALLVCQLSLNAQELKKVSYSDGGVDFQGFVTSNSGGSLPGVLILPAWKGADNEAKAAALALEKQGYIAFIADIYGQSNLPKDDEEASKFAFKYKEDYKAYQHRISLALDQLKKAGAASDKLAIIGYCFGGGGALEASRAGLHVNGVVSIHGYYDKGADRKNDKMQTKVLVQHAANDQAVSKEQYDELIVELNEDKVDWQLINYANSRHTFTNPESKDYNPSMAKRAWDHLLLFLDEVLK